MTIAERILQGGLFNVSDEGYFSWRGCEICNDLYHVDSMGNTVYKVTGILSLDTPDEEYECQVCGSHLNSIVNAEPFDDEVYAIPVKFAH